MLISYPTVEENFNIAIIDYGLGNLGSIKKMFERLKVHSQIVSDPKQLLSYNKAILPGVGHFREGIQNLKSKGWVESLEDFALTQKKPILGICLGMQLMTQGSEEGDCAGLGWFEAYTKKFSFAEDSKLKVPHVGFNLVHITDPILGKDLPDPSKFYFTHSYFIDCKNPSILSGTANYGGTFACMLRKENIFGVQFHPEKSHQFGLQLLSNFAEAS